MFGMGGMAGLCVWLSNFVRIGVSVHVTCGTIIPQIPFIPRIPVQTAMSAFTAICIIFVRLSTGSVSNMPTIGASV